eukprot:g3184.t1
MEVKLDEPGPSSGLLQQTEAEEIRVVPLNLPAPSLIEGRFLRNRSQIIDTALYKAWRAHVFTFVGWMIISITGVILIPFSDTLDPGEAFLVSLGAWMGVIATGLYFLPIPIKSHPIRIKRFAFVITIFSIFAFVMDFPTAVGCIWSIRDKQDEANSHNNDVVLGVASAVLFLGGCFAIVAFAKCMIIGTYEIPSQSVNY